MFETEPGYNILHPFLIIPVTRYLFLLKEIKLLLYSFWLRLGEQVGGTHYGSAKQVD